MASEGMSMNVYNPIEEIPSDADEDYLLDRSVLEIAVRRSRDERNHKKAKKTSQSYEEVIWEFENQDDPILQMMDQERTRRRDSENDITKVRFQIQKLISRRKELQLEYDLMIARVPNSN
ncbi:hypothetical protein BGZ65_010779 [Modicella reniformis]|uniref:Uncharacterized protein n=1 Tax=Modicella reniformis TaxID=1440133 RepID=A0A9P6MDP4_9FUNG|nr:hypothetical protein BGZ65_010779 [Modicella reniformis]